MDLQLTLTSSLLHLCEQDVGPAYLYQYKKHFTLHGVDWKIIKWKFILLSGK